MCEPTSTATRGKQASCSSPRRRWRRSRLLLVRQPSIYGITSQNADGVLAAVGSGLCLALLTYASRLFQVPMMASFLIGATVKMFLNREPPTLTAFWKSSIFGVAAGTAVHYLWQYHVQNAIAKEYVTPLLVTLSMLYWKLTPGAELWAPANNLAIYLATDPWKVWSQYPWYYLWAPYLTGHLFIYLFAFYWSKLRRTVRAQLVTGEFFYHESQQSALLNEAQQEERLRDLFDRMDLDHNGRLDVHELQLAFRKALECDLSLDEARLIMKSADTDGDDTLDYHEFRAAMMDRLPFDTVVATAADTATTTSKTEKQD